MNTVSRLLSALVVSSAFLAIPMVASADETPTALHHGGRTHDKKDKLTFPMKGDEFRKHVETRIEHVKARVEKALDKHNVPAAARTEVKQAVEGAAKEVRGAAQKAAADGVVTQDEAKQVRDLAKQMRETVQSQLKAKNAGGKGGHGGKHHHEKKGADV
ncbi:MAG: hypothetical protein ABI193_16080 [Minicystis sp.]